MMLLRCAKSRKETAAPERQTALVERLDPSWKQFKIELLPDPERIAEATLKPDPNRTKLRIDMEEPTLKKSNTDIFAPNNACRRIDNVEPMVMLSRTENRPEHALVAETDSPAPKRA
jgi:hypothetical protein